MPERGRGRSSRRPRAGSSPTSADGTTSAGARTGRSSRATRSSRCSPWGSAARRAAARSSTSHPRSSRTSGSRRPATRSSGQREERPVVRACAAPGWWSASFAGEGSSDERVLAAMGRSRARRSSLRRSPTAPTTTPRYPSARSRRSPSRTSSPRMCSLLGLTGTEQVLDVGTGSGYAAAVLDELAAEVVSIERIPASRTRATALDETGHGRVEVRLGDGTLGAAERAPFDAIAVAAATPSVPPALYEQLALGGRMVLPARRSARAAARPHRQDDRRARADRSARLSLRSARRGLRPAPARRPAATTATLARGMSERSTSSVAVARARMDAALRRRANWEQLVKFCVVGATATSSTSPSTRFSSRVRASTTSPRRSARSSSR